MTGRHHLKDFEIVDHLPGVKALAHEERLAMLALLSREPLSSAMVAKQLRIAPNRANYHLRVLHREGLVAEAGTGRKRWKEERFYIARAHHYLVDPRIGCQDHDASISLQRSVEAAFLDWRRSQVLSVDLGLVARRVVHDCLAACAGEVVLVLFMPPGIEVAEAIIVELRALGARPRPMVWSKRLALRTLDRHASGSLRDLPFLDPDLDAEIAAGVFVSSHMPEGADPTPEQRAKLPLLLDAVSRWHRTLRERRIRYVEVALPHRGDFDSGIAPPEQAIDTFWRCLDADGRALAGSAERLLARMAGRPSLAIRGPRGTHLQLEVDLAHPFVSDGVISTGDIAAGRSFENLPAGSLSFLPAAGSGRGVLATDYTFAAGRHFRDVKIVIRDGRIAEIGAARDAGALRRLLAGAAGEPERISEVGIGLNPGGRKLTGKAVLDACLEGAVTVAFGNNELIGGDVRSTLTQILPSLALTVRAGDEELVRDGKLS